MVIELFQGDVVTDVLHIGGGRVIQSRVVVEQRAAAQQETRAFFGCGLAGSRKRIIQGPGDPFSSGGERLGSACMLAPTLI